MRNLGRGLAAAMLTLALLIGAVAAADTTVSGPITFSTGLNVGSDGKVTTILSSSAAQTWTAGQSGGQFTPTINGSTFTCDFNQGNHCIIQLVHASCPCTIAAPSNLSSRVGETGVITTIQSSSGSDLVSWNSVFKFAGATAPTLSTAANAVDDFGFYARTSSAVDIGIFGLNIH